MAPQFKKNMFKSWNEIAQGKTIGLVGFNLSEDKSIIFKFRDKLVTILCNERCLIVNKQEGRPTELDSVYRLFDIATTEIVQKFSERKFPGFFSRLLRISAYREWEKEWDSINKSVKIELETSHDFPCLLVYSSICSPDELSTQIKKVASELKIEIYENEQLKNIDKVIMSNRTFDI